jgi:hypothetical protein
MLGLLPQNFGLHHADRQLGGASVVSTSPLRILCEGRSGSGRGGVSGHYVQRTRTILSAFTVRTRATPSWHRIALASVKWGIFHAQPSCSTSAKPALRSRGSCGKSASRTPSWPSTRTATPTLPWRSGRVRDAQKEDGLVLFQVAQAFVSDAEEHMLAVGTTSIGVAGK